MRLFHPSASLLVAMCAVRALTVKAQQPASAPTPFDLVKLPSRSVLTGNAAEAELGIDTGASYIANPPFSNPADPENHRLIDSDRPVADWNTTAGLNAPQQTVTFDLKIGVTFQTAPKK